MQNADSNVYSTSSSSKTVFHCTNSERTSYDALAIKEKSASTKELSLCSTFKTKRARNNKRFTKLGVVLRLYAASLQSIISLALDIFK